MMKRQGGPTSHLQDVFVRDTDFQSTDENSQANSRQSRLDKTDCDRHSHRRCSTVKKRQEGPTSHLQDVFALDMDFQPIDEKFLAKSPQSHLDTTDCDGHNHIHPQHEDESVKDEDEKPANCCSGELCMDFTQSTTLHGLRYVWLPGATALRRVIWFLLVAGCMTVSSYQILDRIVYFYSLPVNVNVKVNFNDSLIFPTVTICNQNTFRVTACCIYPFTDGDKPSIAAMVNLLRALRLLMVIQRSKGTKADQLGHYELLTEMYDDLKSFNLSRLESYDAANLTLNDLFADTAHTKMDMIIGCMWQGEACGPHNFTELMTDHGMCYSFNHPENDRVDVKRILAPGQNRGLTLILNAEYYEYMPGPNHGVGIVVLIHDNKQFPSVTDLGMSLPIGKRSFVAMKLIEANNLPKPHGDCSAPNLDYFEEYSQENCEIECVTKELEGKCGCRLHYMPYNKVFDIPAVCTLSQYLDCYLKVPVRLRQDIHNRCHCPEPCHFKIFEPSVSYASFSSSFNQSKFIQTTNKTNLEMTYLSAREISGRQQNAKLPLTKALTDLEKNIEKSENFLQIFINATNSTINYVDDMVYGAMIKASQARMFYAQCIRSLENTISNGWNPLNEETFSTIADAIEYLFTIETRLKQLVDPQNDDPALRKMFYVSTGDMLDARLEIAKRMKHNISQILTNTTMFFSKFVDSSIDSNDAFLYAKYVESYIFADRDLLNALFINDTDDFTHWILSYQGMLEEAFIEKKLNMTNMQHLRGQYHMSLKKVLRTGNEIFNNVVRGPLDFFKGVDKPIEKLDDRFQRDITLLFRNLENMRNTLDLIRFDPFKTQIKACKEYLSGKMDKLKVAKLYFNQKSDGNINLMKSAFDHVKTFKNYFVPIVDEFADDYDRLANAISFDTFRLSLLSVLHQTDLLSFDSKNDTDDMKRSLLRDYDPLAESEEPLLKAIGVLTQLMNEYVETSEIDVNFLRNNLLQVDLFYRELSYESITQQVGYDLFALLCDIGGSMGLFIGASVVTVFEVLDLIVHLAIKNFKRKRKTN